MSVSQPAGYSGKPLWEKLGIAEGCSVAVNREPRELARWLSNAPGFICLPLNGPTTSDISLIFCTESVQIVPDFEARAGHTNPGGCIWVCWPKKSSKVATDITEQTLRDLLLPLGWVDTKVCAVSDVWSGLKFLSRRV